MLIIIINVTVLSLSDVVDVTVESKMCQTGRPIKEESKKCLILIIIQ